MNNTMKREENGNIVFTITIPWQTVKTAQDAIIDDMVKNATLPGFRKGAAPRNMVEPQLNQAQVREEVLKKILPDAYIAAVQEHKVRPIMNPKIHIEKVENEKDWTFTAITCEIPQVELGNYKDEVKKITAKSKIVVPGKEAEQPNFDHIMQAVLNQVKIIIPHVLIEQEVDRLLAQMLDEVRRLGLTLDQYLGSTGRTPEQLREEYAKKAENDIKLEFTLQKIAETEKIVVDDKEVEEALAKAKDPQERANLDQNRYLLASILRQQKTLDFLKSL
jgi:FKBP-type peptidyl-prolyl cis-trans isomerase (trigger factor)